MRKTGPHDRAATGTEAPPRAAAASPVQDLAELPRAALQSMEDAGREVLDCLRVLGKTGDNMVGELLRGQGTFYEWTHYPEGDVYDFATHAQYYYHAHPRDQRPGEHGHFHTFLRPAGMARGVRPAPIPGNKVPATSGDALCHLVAIAMSDRGVATQLFTTNRWVTDETYYASRDAVAMLGRFAIDLARPSWVINRWISAMMHLFRPQIEALLVERDRVVADWQRRHPKAEVLDDRRLEVVSKADISVEDQVQRVAALLKRARR